MTTGSAAAQPPNSPPERMPRDIKWVIAGLWFQTVTNALGILLVLWVAQNLADHGQDGAGLLRVVALITVPLVVLLAVCAIMAVRGAPWAWSLTMVTEAILLTSGIFILLAKNPGGILGIAIPIVIMRWLSAPESREWYGR